MHDNEAASLAISKDGKHIVSGSWDNTLQVQKTETERCLGEPLGGHSGLVTSVAIINNGRY